VQALLRFHEGGAGNALRLVEVTDLVARWTSGIERLEGMAAGLPRLKPCVISDPDGVSLLPAGLSFDLVAFDEASCLAAYRALPALCRASQIVVAGDERQLPPAVAGGSLLEWAERLPAVRLDMHYRSRHEALFSFNNEAYYGGALRTFPEAASEAAVRIVHSADPLGSLGPADVVLTFRESDRVAAQAALPEARVMRVDESQGGAWDSVALLIGPGALDGVDERVLNVALSRAREGMVVICGEAPDEALRPFLAHQEAAPPPPADDPLAARLARRLEGWGLRVAREVGRGAFRIPLAVEPRDPARPRLAILLDDPGDARARSATTRDRLAPDQLALRGWAVCRVWDQEWRSDPEASLLRLMRALER